MGRGPETGLGARMGKEEEAIFIPSPGSGRVNFLPGQSHFSGSAAGLSPLHPRPPRRASTTPPWTSLPRRPTPGGRPGDFRAAWSVSPPPPPTGCSSIISKREKVYN